MMSFEPRDSSSNITVADLSGRCNFFILSIRGDDPSVQNSWGMTESNATTKAL